MRRIKSAPANLSEMINRKKINNSQSSKIVIPIINKKYNIIIQEIDNKNIIKNDNSKIINTNIIEYNRFKSQKNNLKKIGTFISDIIGDTNMLPFEQNTLITTLINYLSENVLNKDKLKEIYVFILQAIARYLIMLLFHSHFIDIFQQQPLLIDNYLHDLSIK
jgi:iron-sulfur cluster repair protein YtfE (RIC family)